MVRSPKTSLFTHCGVLEFTAPEGRCYMPLWMMERIGVTDGDAVEVAYTVLPLGTGVTLQACTKDFLDISDHRAVLEVMMTKYAALTIGDIFVFHYNKRDYRLEVRDVLPHNRQNAINIVETNLAIEFERPKDMPPEDDVVAPATAAAAAADDAETGAKKKKKKKSHKRKRDEEEDGVLMIPDDASIQTEDVSHTGIADSGSGFIAFSGEGHSLSTDSSSSSLYKSEKRPSTSSHHADSGTEFVPFSGEAHTLSGRCSSRTSYSSSSSSHPQANLTASSPARSTSNSSFGRNYLPSSSSSTPSSSQRSSLTSSGYIAFQGEGHRLG